MNEQLRETMRDHDLYSCLEILAEMVDEGYLEGAIPLKTDRDYIENYLGFFFRAINIREAYLRETYPTNREP